MKTLNQTRNSRIKTNFINSKSNSKEETLESAILKGYLILNGHISEPKVSFDIKNTFKDINKWSAYGF